MNANDSCRLIAVNLFSFVDNPFTEEAKVNLDKVYEVFYEAMRLGDNLVDLEVEHIERIIDKIKSDPEPDYIKKDALRLWENSIKACQAGRRVGLGITALGDMLAALGLKYDSGEGLEIVDQVMRTKMEAELDCNVDLAILRGPFEGWDRLKEYDEDGVEQSSFYGTIAEKFREQVLKMLKYGRRSVNWSTIAPTGSVSIMTQTTSGCEPLFQPYYMRRKKINPGEEGVRVDFVDELGDSWQEFPILHPKFKEFIIEECGKTNIVPTLTKEELERWYCLSPWYGSTANDIDWIKRVEMQSVLQLYTTNSISSTLNLPEEVTYEEVGEIYMESWKQGLKGVTVYREGSRSGVLVSDKDKKVLDTERGKELPCDIEHITSEGKKFTILLGMKNERPFEMFCIPQNIATRYEQGVLIKEGNGNYTLKCGESESYGVFKDVTESMSGEYQNLTRAWSLLLKYNVPIEKIVEQIQKSDESITALSKAVSRVLSKRIPDGTEVNLTCEECGSTEVIFEEGCSKCLNCGSSKCG